MRFLGFEITRPKTTEKALNSVESDGWKRIFDWRPGAWQTHSQYRSEDSVLAYHAVFSCTTLIASDTGKLRPMVQVVNDGIWKERKTAVTDILERPNTYQNHLQFKEYWLLSKLIHGNTYVLKIRDRGSIIRGLVVLDPNKVEPLVSDGGEVFYRLDEDNLARVNDGQIVVPASEIIHDRIHPMYHPLVGLSPIFACGQAATMGLKIESNAKNFFKNGNSPGGVLTAPGNIDDSTANRLKTYWEANFTGDNAGRVAVLGDGLKYEGMRMSNVDAQMIEHLKWSAEVVCGVFKVPPFLVAVGPMPSYNNIEALTQQYYSQCLQFHIESLEAALHDGLGMPDNERVQLDLDGLFRMDTATLIETLGKGTGAAIMSPDEARARMNLPPVPGGKYPYLQQQNYSLEALAQRDASNPLAIQGPPVEPQDELPEEKHLAYLKYLTDTRLGAPVETI